MLELSLVELLFIGVVALVVIGPQDLPKVLKAMIGLFKQIQGVVNEVRSSVDDLVEESGVHDVKEDMKYIIDQNGEYQRIYDIDELIEAEGGEVPKRNGTGDE